MTISTGNFGIVTVSSGVADRLVGLLDAAVNTSTGNIKVRQDGIATTIENLDADIERKSLSVSRFELRTLQQFQRLEVLLGQLQQQSQTLSSALAGLTNLSLFISGRRR